MASNIAPRVLGVDTKDFKVKDLSLAEWRREEKTVEEKPKAKTTKAKAQTTAKKKTK